MNRADQHVPTRKPTPVESFKPEGILLASIEVRRYSGRTVDTVLRPYFGNLLDEKIQIELPEWWRGSGRKRRRLTRRNAVLTQLEIAAALLPRDQMWMNQPRRSDVIQRLEEVKAATVNLLHSLGLGVKHMSNSKLIPYALRSRLLLYAGLTSAKAPERLEAVVHGIKDLHGWIERDLRTLLHYPTIKLTHKGDKAFNSFLQRLGDVWLEILGKRPRINFVGGNSRNEGQPCGPFFAFIELALAPLALPERLTRRKALGSRLARLFNRKRGRKAQQDSQSTG